MGFLFCFTSYGLTQHEAIENYCDSVDKLFGYREFDLAQHCQERVSFFGPNKVCVLVSRGVPDVETCRYLVELKSKSYKVKSSNLVKMSTTQKPTSLSEFETTFRYTYFFF